MYIEEQDSNGDDFSIMTLVICVHYTTSGCNFMLGRCIERPRVMHGTVVAIVICFIFYKLLHTYTLVGLSGR